MSKKPKTPEWLLAMEDPGAFNRAMKAAAEEDLNQRSRGVYLDRNMRPSVTTPSRKVRVER